MSEEAIAKYVDCVLEHSHSVLTIGLNAHARVRVSRK